MLIVLATLSLCVSTAAARERGASYTITTKLGKESQVASLSSKGEAIYLIGANRRPESGYVISYARREVTVIDFGRRRYQQMTLDQAVAFAKAQRAMLAHSGSPYVKLPPSVHKPDRLRRLKLRRRIKGVPAEAWLDKRASGDVSRIWFAAAAPRPPAAVARLLKGLEPPGGASLVGNAPLLVEHRVGKRFKIEAIATKVRHGVSASAFRPPAGFHPATLVKLPGAKASSIPAHLTTGTGYFPEESGQSVFAVFQGTRFAGEPETVARLDAALEHVITQRPYLDGLDASYGIAPGRFAGSAVRASNPNHTVGDDKNPVGYLEAFVLVSEAMTLPGAPQRWGRFDTYPPLIVLFVPEELVDGGGNYGYHSVAPVSSSLLDPFGLVYLQVMPFAIVKVPPASNPGFIDGATWTLSHETVEAATDPVPTDGWNDGTKAHYEPPEQGEVADVCHEGNFTPFGDKTRVAGVEVATYWAQALGVCFPESRPSVTINFPAPGSTVYAGQHLDFSASANDPLDGPLTGIAWSDGDPGHAGSAALSTGTTMSTAFHTAGQHHVVARVVDSQGAVGEAEVTVNVVEPRPTAKITLPEDGTEHPIDESLNLHGSGHDPVDGTLSGEHLKWYLDGSEVAIGSDATAQPTTEGLHTITLVATDSNGQESAPATVHVTIGPPGEGPSIHIESPFNEHNYPHAETEYVYFKCSATDPNEVLSTSDIVWYDDYTDVHGVHQHKALGEGCSGFDSYLYTAGESTEVTHKITAIATDALNRHGEDSVTITAGVSG